MVEKQNFKVTETEDQNTSKRASEGLVNTQSLEGYEFPERLVAPVGERAGN